MLNDILPNQASLLYNSLELIIRGAQQRIQRPGKGGAEKHKIYAAAFGGHRFYDLFSQGQAGLWPLGPPGSATGAGKSTLPN